MFRLLRLTLAALLVAAPTLLTITPRSAHAFCIMCDAVGVVEYVNEISGHYLLLPTYDPEVAAVESGTAGPGWLRTGNDFTTSSFGMPVCRFYSPTFNTHFYTVDATECALVKQNPDWTYEKSPFNAGAPVNGACPGSYPVYRLYHAGDHRYTADSAVRGTMLGKGWIDEGLAFCVRYGGGRGPVETFQASPTKIDSTQACQAGAGACVALDSLPAMPNRVPPYLPPFYITLNPAYPSGVDSIVGTNGQFDLYTNQNTVLDPYTGQAANPSPVLQHSFASFFGALSINGHDRTSGDYAAISPMIELPGVAGPTSDARAFIWRSASDHELRVNAFANVGVVARDGSGSHAYGGPLLQFGDASSGHSFRVTLQAYGTVPPGDFTAPDARTGEPIVSTVFRRDPAFGSVLSGSFIPCSGDGTPCAPYVKTAQQVPFSFSLKRADFQAALDRARTVDPALSGNPTSYFLGRVEFHNETYLDARLGATITDLVAQVWYVE